MGLAGFKDAPTAGDVDSTMSSSRRQPHYAPEVDLSKIAGSGATSCWARQVRRPQGPGPAVTLLPCRDPTAQGNGYRVEPNGRQALTAQPQVAAKRIQKADD